MFFQLHQATRFINYVHTINCVCHIVQLLPENRKYCSTLDTSSTVYSLKTVQIVLDCKYSQNTFCENAPLSILSKDV